MIMNKLKEKHEEKYTPEQFRVWAHMIQMKKYESYGNPPDKTLFGKSRKKALSTATQAAISPGKRLSMRSECIDQLDNWHKLMERGAISPEEYKELQGTILTDIKKF